MENRRIYESLTDDDPGPAGRKRAKLTAEACRYANSLAKKGKPVPAKSMCNEWGMIHSVLHKYSVNAIDFEQIEFSTITPKLSELPPAKTVLSIIKGLILNSGNYITTHEVIVYCNNKQAHKELAKNPTYNRACKFRHTYRTWDWSSKWRYACANGRQGTVMDCILFLSIVSDTLMPLSWLCFEFRTNMLRSREDGKQIRSWKRFIRRLSQMSVYR